MAQDDDRVAWTPRVVGAQAFDRDRFVVAWGELDDDDPFTAILEYDGSFTQPWSRTDVSRQIKAVSAVPAGDEPTAHFAALSDEGDVYFNGEETKCEKIPGAGIASPDAAGLGGLLDLAAIGSSLIAVGQGGQVYERRSPGRWDRLQVVGHAEPGFQPIAFTRIRSSSERDIHLLGVAAPATPQLDPKTETALLATDDWDAWDKAHEDLAARSGAAGRVNEGRAVHWNGAAWRKLALPSTEVVMDAFVETPSKVWLVGTRGAILVGNASDGFKPAGSSADIETLLSFTRLGDTYYAASDHMLHTFDGRNLSLLRPRLRRGPPTPFRVQAAGDVLFYFDYKQGVHRFDGTTWDAIPIPPELLQRPFSGLPRPLR